MAKRWAISLRVSGDLPGQLGLDDSAAAAIHDSRGEHGEDDPACWLAAMRGTSAFLVLVALSVPARRALRTLPVEAIGIRE